MQAFWAFYGILWYFGIFAKKSYMKSNPILSDFFPSFGLFPTFRLSDFTTVVQIVVIIEILDYLDCLD